MSFNDHLVGKIMVAPVLKALVLDEPKSDSILLRHPSGRPVEYLGQGRRRPRRAPTLVAAGRPGFAADEAPRMYGDEAVVAEDSVRAVNCGASLTGAQICSMGRLGPVYGPPVVARCWPGLTQCHPGGTGLAISNRSRTPRKVREKAGRTRRSPQST